VRAGPIVRWVAAATVVVALLGWAPAVAAAPANPDGTGGGTLQAQLDTAARGYNDAQGRLDAARQRETELTAQSAATQAQLADLVRQVGAVAATAYKGGRITGLTVLLDSGSPDDLLYRAETLDAQLRHDDRVLAQLHAVQERYDRQRAELAQQINTQQVQLAELVKRKNDAERALAAAASGGSASGVAPGRASATPAPRAADGSWPKESCSVPDPTTSGCLTPRTLHALQEVQKAGFTHYVACFRPGTFGEHPLGRACDFAAHPTGFLDATATGADKAYGDQLAGWLLANADRLAVLYVIWYRQIWMPGLGWRAYHGDGTAAGDHMNHVHLSVQ
jgi:peptidoglycan DL-endopeptidase CwlO